MGMTDRGTGPQGIGGWLAALFVVLGVVAPLCYFYLLWRTLGGQTLHAQYTGELVPWQVRAATWSSCLVKTAIALSIVWRMMRVRRRETIRFALVGIWVLAVGMVFVDLGLAWLARAPMLESDALPFFVAQMLSIGLALALPATFYLLKSRRVANTYRPDGSLVRVFE
jgi:hypothetical protein